MRPGDLAARLLNPADSPNRQTEKLLEIVEVLMRRVETGTDLSGAAYAQFERAAMLEDQVRARTRDLEAALALLNDSNAQLAAATRAAEATRRNLADALEAVQEGFGLFGPDDVMVMCNTRFGLQLPDIRPALVPGLGFADYIDLASRSSALLLPEGVSPQDWALQRLSRHQDRSSVFTVALKGDRWLQVSEHRTGDGGTVLLQTDITDILRAERAARGRLLDDQARLVRATLDHIGQGVCIFDPLARLVGWNARAAELLALSRRQLRTGLELDALLDRLAPQVAPADGARLAALRDWAARPGARAPLRFELVRGADAVLDAFAQEMPDRGFVISFTDVTAERRAIAALSRANETLEARVSARTLELGQALAGAERANATRTRFVAAASHDLLQPLSAAKLFLASMADDPLSPRAQQALDKARAALGSVETILDALLDISRLESGRPNVQLQPVALAPLLAQLIDEVAPQAAAKGLSLRLRVSGQASVVSDRTWLRRILQNLIGNAVRYTETGGVLVGLRNGLAGLRVEVIDTGPGIADSDREAIFREFHRLNARASASEGLGLGLAIVERACAVLGHAVTLESRPGRGSRFVVHLGPGAEAPPESPAPAAPGGLPSDLIGLLVAADPEMRRALAHLLEGWGVSVLDTPDPAEALALIDEIGLAPDFVLIDARPGDEDAGIALMQALTQRHGPLPARLLSATRAESLRLRTRRAGLPLLYKPVDTGLLHRFIAECRGG